MARTPELSEKVVDQLKKMITQNMKPGDQLPTEGELMSIFAVSRSTIRESLKVLSALGLVVRRSGGTFVNNTVNDCLVEPLHIMLDLEVASVSDLLEMRALLELDVISLVAEKISDESIRELERYVWQMQNPDASDSDFQKIDIQFHRRLAEATGNAILVELICSVRNVISEKQAETCKIQPIQKQVIASHNKLMDALRAHNTEQALAYMKEHLRISQVFYGFMPESSCEGDKVDNLHWRESVKSE